MSVSTRSKRRLSYGQAGASVDQEDCDPALVCALCKETHQYTSTVHSWQSTQAQSVVSEYGITQNDTVCRPCRDDIRRVVANPDLKPRWRKEQEKKCCVKDCADTCHVVHSKLIDSDNAKKLLESTTLQFENNRIPFPTPLCSQHYHIAYSAIQPRQIFCPTCGISLRHAITRQCPNADLIKEHLTKTTDFNGTLLPEDKVCFTCYKAHFTILQEEKKISRDGDLQLLIEEVQQHTRTYLIS